MRRKDREIVDSGKINEIILDCDCCRIGFCEEEGAYIVPLNFGYTQQKGQRIFYFHGAGEGKKAVLAEKRPVVGFELDTGHALKRGEAACGYSFAYQSVTGKGIFESVTDLEECICALRMIMSHYSGIREWQFSEEVLSKTMVYKLTVTEMTCKENKPD